MVLLKNYIPEHIRAIVCRRIAKSIYQSMRDKQGHQMADATSQAFIRQCELTEGMPVAPSKIEVERSELAKFIDRWMHVARYQDLDTGEWKPISPTMNGIRVSMCAELLELGGFDPLQYGLR